MTPVMNDLVITHERGIIHCDIKPENLMISPDGQLVLNLGMMSILHRIHGDPDAVLCPASESAIEQYDKTGEIGPWTDVYAMCATIYYCVSGKSLTTWIDRLAEATPIDLSCFSPAVRQTLQAGLAIKPKDRIQSMHELRQKLQSAVLNEEKGKLQPPKTVYGPPGLWSFFRRKR